MKRKFLLGVICGCISVLTLMGCSQNDASSLLETKENSNEVSSIDPFAGKGITIYTRDTTSGTRDGFFTTIGFADAKADNKSLASGYIEAKGNSDMIQYLKNDEYGIGYISLSTLDDSGLKGLKYEGVEPSEENVLNTTYELTRNFNYCLRETYESDTVKEICEAFIAYMGTREGKATIINKNGILKSSATDKSWEDIKADYPVTKKDNSKITIKFGGSTSVTSIVQSLSSEFSKKCGNFVAEHNHTGSSDAFKRTQGSEKDSSNALHIGFASREFSSSETLKTETYGLMCIDAIVAVVHATNSLDTVTAVELKNMYNGTYTKWDQVKK